MEYLKLNIWNGKTQSFVFPIKLLNKKIMLISLSLGYSRCLGILYKLCVLVSNCVHGSASGYLHEVIIPVLNAELRRMSALCLLGRFDHTDHTSTTRRFSLGDRAFTVASLRVCASEVTTIIMALYKCLYYYYWNTLPNAVWRCSSPDCFKCLLKTHLYIQC